MNWIKQVGKLLPDYYDPQTIPDVGELDELETFVGSKKTKSGYGQRQTTLKQGFQDGFQAVSQGECLRQHSAKTFADLWEVVSRWKCHFYVKDGWKVYPNFIPDGDQIISQTYMTRVEGENTRLRHYLARLHRKTLCYSKSEQMLRHSIRLLIHYLKFEDVPVPYSNHRNYFPPNARHFA